MAPDISHKISIRDIHRQVYEFVSHRYESTRIENGKPRDEGLVMSVVDKVIKDKVLLGLGVELSPFSAEGYWGGELMEAISTAENRDDANALRKEVFQLLNVIDEKVGAAFKNAGVKMAEKQKTAHSR